MEPIEQATAAPGEKRNAVHVKPGDRWWPAAFESMVAGTLDKVEALLRRPGAVVIQSDNEITVSVPDA